MHDITLACRSGMAAFLAVAALFLFSCNKPASEQQAGADPVAETQAAEANQDARGATPAPAKAGPGDVRERAPDDLQIAAGEGEDETGEPPELPDMVDGSPAMMSEEAFLSAWRDFEGVVVLEDGLMYRVIASGKGRSPKPTDKVRVSYRGTLMDGSVFDETALGETKVLDLSTAIEGLRRVLPLMKEGDKWELVVPSALAYGEEGNGVIAANMPLVFEIQLVEVAAS